MSENTVTEKGTAEDVPFAGTKIDESPPKRKKSLYSPREKYIVACGHIEQKSYIDIAKDVGREPIDVYHALRSEWARSLCYAISIERGEDERDANLRWGNHQLDGRK